MALAIETERLTLRLRDERDAVWYHELVRERGEDTPTFEESAARLARFRDLTTEIGVGVVAICRRAEGDAIGYCALIVGRGSLDEPEIAFELLKRFHGHGYCDGSGTSYRGCRRCDRSTPSMVDGWGMEHAVAAGA